METQNVVTAIRAKNTPDQFPRSETHRGPADLHPGMRVTVRAWLSERLIVSGDHNRNHHLLLTTVVVVVAMTCRHAAQHLLLIAGKVH